jgi:hypothetical protein
MDVTYGVELCRKLSDNNPKLGVPTVQCRYVSRIAGHCRLSNERQRMGHPSNHGSTHGIRTVRSKCDADFILAGKAQPVVHSGVRGRMCAGINLRLSPRCVGIRSRGSRVVSGRASPLVRPVLRVPKSAWTTRTCGTCTEPTPSHCRF